MNPTTTMTTTRTKPDTAGATGWLLCFRPLARTGAEPLAFGCDAAGRIDLDALSERDRGEYLYARALIGFAFARPAVQPVGAATLRGAQ